MTTAIRPATASPAKNNQSLHPHETVHAKSGPKRESASVPPTSTVYRKSLPRPSPLPATPAPPPTPVTSDIEKPVATFEPSPKPPDQPATIVKRVAVPATMASAMSLSGPTHLLHLLTVKDRRRRDILARKAVEGRWGVTQLETAILRLHERRPEVGRKPRVPDDPAQIRLVLEGLCLKWRRWCEAAQPRLPEEMRELVKKATRAIAAVKEAVVAKRGKPPGGKQQKA